MSVKPYKLALSSSSQKIKKAKDSLSQMSQSKKIELMVKAGALTDKQAAVAKKKLGEGKMIE
jgi:hypothetical protein